MKSKKKHVAFLMGGLSSERDVSINSGNACYDAIDKEKYRATKVIIDKNFYDYSTGIYNKTAKTGGGGHPLINSVLGNYFDHMKGARKTKGKSQKKDLISTRAESYWNEV